MNFSKMLACTAIVLVGSLVLATEASGPHYRANHRGHPAPPAYLPAYLPDAPAPQHRAPHGPYHSYAVRPAVYGGPHLYTYRGYARHPRPLAPVAVHLKAAAYSPYSNAPIVAPLALAIEAAECHGYNCHHALAPAYNAGHGLRPVKAVLLAPIVAAPLRSAYPKKQAYREPAAPAAYNTHAALAGPLYRGEALRPAGYGAGHYYQALETLQVQGGYKQRSKSASSSAGGY